MDYNSFYIMNNTNKTLKSKTSSPFEKLKVFKNESEYDTNKTLKSKTSSSSNKSLTEKSKTLIPFKNETLKSKTPNKPLTGLPLAEKLAKEVNIFKSYAQYDEYNKNIKESLEIYNKLCLNPGLPPDDKINILISFKKYFFDDYIDMLNRYRDQIPFLIGPKLKDLITLIVKITRNNDFDSHQRLTMAVVLYNQGFLGVCYDCFSDLACDRSVLVNYRIESARFLSGSERDDYKKTALQSLIDIINTSDYKSFFRYKIIAGFISKTGISTFLNQSKIKVCYDEEFVYELQKVFFFNENNGIRERLLSGQHILQMSLKTIKDKEKVEDIMLSIASDKELEEKVRADASDIISRLGTTLYKRHRALEIIQNLGKGVDGTKTIYDDSQNIHNFTDQVNEFIIKLMNEKVEIRPYHEVHQEVSKLVTKYKLSINKRNKVYASLNRIDIDTATFTEIGVTSVEIFVRTWCKIKNYSDEEVKEMLEKRLLEELIEMSETCSTGHSSRFINVFNGVEYTLKINWGDQIKANIKGRMNARIRDCKDTKILSQIALGTLEDAETEDSMVYREFITDNLIELKKELYKEFVDECHISNDEFEIHFNEGSKKW